MDLKEELAEYNKWLVNVWSNSLHIPFILDAPDAYLRYKEKQSIPIPSKEKDFFKDMQDWEASFYCRECGNDNIKEFSYIRTVANGDIHKCKCCGYETVMQTKPNEDHY